MKSNSHSYPHPILRSHSDDIISSIALIPEPSITDDSENYYIDIHFHHDNPTIDQLINNGFAEYFCEATCSDTLYRENEKTNQQSLTFKIPKKIVKGRVKFTCKVVAKKEIPNYKNSNQHNDYENEMFNIEIGDPLAIFDDFHFDFDIVYEKIKNPSAFMNIVENTDLDISGLSNISKDKIEIQLTSKDYKTYLNDRISKNKEYATTFHATIAYPALLNALYNYHDVDEELLWRKIIEYRLNHDQNIKDLSIDDKGNIPEIALRILGNPISRLLTDIEETETTNHNEEELL
jgi:hypothetical protein